MNTFSKLLFPLTVIMVGSAIATTAFGQTQESSGANGGTQTNSATARGRGGRGGGGGGGIAGGQTIGKANSLTAVASPTAMPDPDGFIQRWLILEPIPGDGRVTENAVKATVKQEFFPNQLTILPKDGDKVTSGGQQFAWHAVDTKLYNVDLRYFAYMLNTSSDNTVIWAVTVINCPEEMHNVRLAIGSNSATVWWVNGQEVTGVYGDIQTTVDDAVSKRLTLKKGPNVIRTAMVNNGGACDFCARILDEQGNPVKNFTVNLSDAAH
jgi:hypothetical protein